LKLEISNMKIAKLHLSLVALVLLFGGLRAQYGLQSTLLRDRIWSQAAQPANLMEGDLGQFRFGAQGSFWLGNSHAPLAGVFAENGYITQAVKDRLVGDLKAKEDISAGYHLNLASVNVHLGSQRFGFYLDEYASIYTRFNNPNTLGLVLKGNGAYAGDTVSDQGISAKFLRTRDLSIGTGWKTDKLSIGLRLRLKQGIKMADLDHLNYSLYTAPNGTQVNVQAGYDLFVTPKIGKVGLFEFQGYGAGIDLGMRYMVSEKLDIDFAANDIGFTSWTTNNIADSVNVAWDGISIASLLQDSISPIIDHQVDSLKNLLLPDTVEARRIVYSPLSIRANATWHISEKASLSGTVVWYPLAVGQRSRLPLIGVAYQHVVVPGLTLGANAYGLGLDAYGFGAMASYRLNVGSASIDLLAGSDNLLGLVVPSIGRGMNAYAGVGVSF
jgi:Family of unknown function (DUF5723)